MHNLLKFFELKPGITLGDIFTFLSVLVISCQVNAANLNNTLVNLDLLRKEETKVRKKIHKSDDEIKELTNFLVKNPKLSQESFFSIYGKKKYKYIRQIGYFYEYLGIIVKKRAIKFSVIFSLFSFPDEFWNETELFRNIVIHKVGIPDFWENFSYLQKKYEKSRKK